MDEKETKKEETSTPTEALITPVQPEPKKNGRPSIYTVEIIEEICQRIANGESLLRVCKDEHMPERTTVHLWLLDPDKLDFFNKYTHAREVQASNMFDELNEIAEAATDAIVGDDKSDNARVQSYKLRVDTKKWYLSKVVPKIYGNKLDVTSDGKRIEGNSITFLKFDEPTSKP